MAIDQSDTTPGQEAQPSGEAKYLRVRVVDHTKGEQPTVNVRLPIGLARWGMKMASGVSPEMKDANLDWEAIATIVDGGARGEIVHVEDEAKHQTVDVFVE
jgi:hypothetical protein